MAATRTLARMEGPQWARIEDTAILCSPQKAKLDDNLAITVNFKLNGGIRRNFTRDLWEKAYDEHDAGLLMIFWVELLRNRPLLSKPIKTDKFKRRAIFFWTRNPELPYRVWIDRKSTRLNSSHANISYAVFCLKKKKKTAY